ncbi:MAG: D-alanine--D-serine ligase VanG [Acetatifactor sp.]|nr:D-alanine--D-serine ligase VanG [Acetatifactor sp.]
MKKQNVLIFFGGCSSEYSVSLSSASGVLLNLDPNRYNPVTVGISREGKWYYYTGSTEKILEDTWQNVEDCTPAALSPSRGDCCLLLLRETGTERIPIDIALPVLHGKNGEDGTLQGLLELAGIPLAGCGVLASALCMDKDRAHKLAGLAGIRVPKALVVEAQTPQAVDFAREIGYPLYVKPVRAGSSYGVTKVNTPDELIPALSLALQYDTLVILEENIEGFEVGCAVLGSSDLIVGEVDEIQLSGGFFDFTEKYTLKTSAIHVPARISPEKSAEIKEAAKCIYRALGCSGFARVDLFLTPAGEIVFNEVNTIPGFTAHSRYPGMMKAAGYSFTEILTMILEDAQCSH